jgi:O-antigen ligase
MFGSVAARRSKDLAAHNTFLGILVEHGLVGLTLFGCIIWTLMAKAWRTPALESRMWMVTLLAWCVGAMSLSWENREMTWLLWGLCASYPLLARRHAVRRVPSWSPHAQFPSTA